MSSGRKVIEDWKVLAVDDDPNSLEIMRSLLEFYGATVYTAVNGKQGLEKAKESLPDFIVTDLSMPEMNGWDMIAALKADIATAPIPIIALTAHAMVGDREKAIEAGCHNYLSKPLRPDTFARQLLKMLTEIEVLSVKLNS